MTRENPGFGEVIVNDVADWEDLPDTNNPYIVLAGGGEGFFLHRKTAQGRGLVPWTKWPTTPKPTGHKNGYFLFNGEPIPAKIYAQAVDFFRRIFAKHHTEAAVVITQHKETGEYRLFIPTQDVSHGAVRQIYNTAHVSREYLIVGTFHSHCDFSPGHSSTDEGDARDFDGIHGTIGYVNRDVPEMALMYALNGSLFHFRMPFTNIVDMSDLKAGTAPEWWDRYVITTKVTDADRQRLAPYADDVQWDRFMGRRKQPEPQVQPGKGPYGYQPHGPTSTTAKELERKPLTDAQREALRKWADKNPQNAWAAELLNESKDFNERQRLKYLNQNERSTDERIYDDDLYDQILAEEELQMYTYGFWEAELGKELTELLFESGLVSDGDFEEAIENWPRSGHQIYWENRMRGKLFSAKRILEKFGLTVHVNVTDTRIVPVTGQTTMDDQMIGVH